MTDAAIPQSARPGNPAPGRATLAAAHGGGQGIPTSATRCSRARVYRRRCRPRMTPGAADSDRGALLILDTAGETQQVLARWGSTCRQTGRAAMRLSRGAAFPAISAIGRQEMIMLYAVLGYAALAAVIVFLIWRLTKAKEDLAGARRTAAHAQARQEAAKQAAQVARQRCRKALGQAEQCLAQTGQALEIAGHIRLVSQQVNGLIAYITGPFDELPSVGSFEEPPPLGYRPGRHALPAGAGHQDLNDDAQTQMEFIP
jgi:hypothetical protein